MSVILDEGVPVSLAGALTAIGMRTDPFRSTWKGLRNGELLTRLEAAGYAVLVTNDKNMAFQQSLRNRSLAVVALPSNRRNTILGRVEDIADSIRRAVPGCHVVMDRNGTRALRRYDGHAWIVDPLPPLRPFSDQPG